MDEQEKKTDGLIVPDSAQAVSGGAGVDVPGYAVLREIVSTPLEDLPEAAVVRAVDILARGTVLCAIAFIILSFLYPDRITTALSIVVPIVTLLFQHRQAMNKALKK